MGRNGARWAATRGKQLNGNGWSRWFTPADIVKGMFVIVMGFSFLLVMRDDVNDLKQSVEEHMDTPGHIQAWRAIGALEAQVETLQRQDR